MLNKLLKNLGHGADWIGLREVEESNTSVYIRNGKPEANNQYLDHGIMVEVLVDGNFGYAATDDLSLAGVKKAFEKAKSLARQFSPHKIYSFDKSFRPVARGKYNTASKMDLDKMSMGEINDFLSLTCDRLGKREEIINSHAHVMLTDSKTRFVSTNGSEFETNQHIINHELSVTAQKGSEIQTRSWGNASQIGLELLNRDIFFAQGERIVNEVVELLNAKECPSETMDILVAPDQMILQIHESIGHPLEVDRILGDERNYAGWSFVNKEDFGKLKYGSELLNITFDPTFEGELASYDFDDTGVKAEKTYLIKNGLLLRGLGGIESQKRSGIEGVANSRASSWNRAPIDRMANINLDPGTSTLKDMVKNIKRGVYLFTNRSWSIDDFRNKFQFGCEYGKLIVDGEIKETIKNPNYRGISTPFWNNLTMVGDSSTLEVNGTSYCGKGEPNQAIRVGHASPTCLFKDVEVFGGA
ncbi:MAG: TldD/PmbA family protein [Epsilonproteobacteria bacterium]|nr:MAG: TldD/PmbA family protein [Campylobacterota bacterium]RLA66895.1 MAG: TldD/PmbA family protein [Campylobacterota bacterium]